MRLQPPPETHDPFFAPKHFEAAFELGGRRYLLEVHTPDLRGRPASMWADWGPMYTTPLDDDSVTVGYACPETDEVATYRFCPSSIEVQSTALAVERERQPFVLVLVDAARGLRIQARMNRKGDVEGVDVDPLHVQLDIPSLLFRSSAESTHTGAAAAHSAADAA